MLSQQTGVPAQVIAVIHYHEAGNKDFDFKTGKIYFSSYLHNGDPLGANTINVPKGIFFRTDQFDEAAIDALEAKYSNALNSSNEAFKSNNMSAYNATALKDGNDSIVAMLTFMEYYNGKSSSKISTYLFNGALDASGQGIVGVGKYTSDGNYDPNAVNKQPGAYLLLESIL